MPFDYRAECAYIMNRLHGVFGLPEVIIPIDDGGPGPAPAPEVVGSPDANGLTGLRSVNALVAAEGPTVAIAGAMPGEPNVAPVQVPVLFQTPESVAAMPEGEAKERAQLSLAASELHQNGVQLYERAPFYKPWLKWVESGRVLNAVSSKNGAAWLAQAIVGRHRGIKAGQAQPHFLWLTDRDHAAGA